MREGHGPARWTPRDSNSLAVTMLGYGALLATGLRPALLTKRPSYHSGGGTFIHHRGACAAGYLSQPA